MTHPSEEFVKFICYLGKGKEKQKDQREMKIVYKKENNEERKKEI